MIVKTRYIKQLIKEELSKVLKEMDYDYRIINHDIDDSYKQIAFEEMEKLKANGVKDDKEIAKHIVKALNYRKLDKLEIADIEELSYKVYGKYFTNLDVYLEMYSDPDPQEEEN